VEARGEVHESGDVGTTIITKSIKMSIKDPAFISVSSYWLSG
jgi:hypothetical protein